MYNNLVVLVIYSGLRIFSSPNLKTNNNHSFCCFGVDSSSGGDMQNILRHAQLLMQESNKPYIDVGIRNHQEINLDEFRNVIV